MTFDQISFQFNFQHSSTMITILCFIFLLIQISRIQLNDKYDVEKIENLTDITISQVIII